MKTPVWQTTKEMLKGNKTQKHRIRCEPLYNLQKLEKVPSQSFGCVDDSGGPTTQHKASFNYIKFIFESTGYFFQFWMLHPADTA